MRLQVKGALLLLLFCPTGILVVSAQQRQKGSDASYRAVREVQEQGLTLDDGLAILNAALDSRHHKGFSSDCSHFVHGLYERAGFRYDYASSSDLYAGIDEFRRVVNPQPGDLAVWRGHAGIVVNPLQHCFFSLLSSAPGVDSYDAPYWKRRGRPRFFRYMKLVSTEALSGSLRSASLSPAVEDPVSDDAEESSGESQISTLATNRVVSPSIFGVPLVHSIRPEPDQVSAAFLQACTEAEVNLRGRDLFKSAQPLIVFDHFTVNEVHIAANEGWAEVQIDEVFFLVDGKAEARKGFERQRWTLSRRDKTSWELTAPRGAIYLPQQVAVRVLSHQLAQLTEEHPEARPQQKAELARVLDSLLQE